CGRPNGGAGDGAGRKIVRGREPLWTPGGSIMSDNDALRRWRLVLGGDAESGLGFAPTGDDARRDRSLSYLYNREYDPARNTRTDLGRERSGGLEDSELTVPEWINEVHELFPRRTIE